MSPPPAPPPDLDRSKAVNRGHACSELGVETGPPRRSKLGSELELALTGGVTCTNGYLRVSTLAAGNGKNLRSQPPKLATSSWLPKLKTG